MFASLNGVKSGSVRRTRTRHFVAPGGRVVRSTYDEATNALLRPTERELKWLLYDQTGRGALAAGKRSDTPTSDVGPTSRSGAHQHARRLPRDRNNGAKERTGHSSAPGPGGGESHRPSHRRQAGEAPPGRRKHPLPGREWASEGAEDISVFLDYFSRFYVSSGSLGTEHVPSRPGEGSYGADVVAREGVGALEVASKPLGNVDIYGILARAPPAEPPGAPAGKRKKEQHKKRKERKKKEKEKLSRGGAPLGEEGEHAFSGKASSRDPLAEEVAALQAKVQGDEERTRREAQRLNAEAAILQRQAPLKAVAASHAVAAQGPGRKKPAPGGRAITPALGGQWARSVPALVAAAAVAQNDTTQLPKDSHSQAGGQEVQDSLSLPPKSGDAFNSEAASAAAAHKCVGGGQNRSPRATSPQGLVVSPPGGLNSGCASPGSRYSEDSFASEAAASAAPASAAAKDPPAGAADPGGPGGGSVVHRAGDLELEEDRCGGSMDPTRQAQIVSQAQGVSDDSHGSGLPVGGLAPSRAGLGCEEGQAGAAAAAAATKVEACWRGFVGRCQARSALRLALHHRLRRLGDGKLSKVMSLSEVQDDDRRRLGKVLEAATQSQRPLHKLPPQAYLRKCLAYVDRLARRRAGRVEENKRRWVADRDHRHARRLRQALKKDAAGVAAARRHPSTMAAPPGAPPPPRQPRQRTRPQRPPHGRAETEPSGAC